MIYIANRFHEELTGVFVALKGRIETAETIDASIAGWHVKIKSNTARESEFAKARAVSGKK